MRILITGSRGFVGGSIGRYAARLGHEVLGISRSSQPEENWLGMHTYADASVSDLSGIINGFKPDCLIHCAGTASVAASVQHPLDDFRASVTTWANTLDSIRRSSIRPVIIFPSSAAVYGNPVINPVSEKAAVAPISPYGFHKANCELLAQEYAVCYNLKIIVCRFFSLLGPGQKRLLTWEIYKQLAAGKESVWLEGSGDELRDYLYIDDVAAALLGLAQKRAEQNENELCQMVNIASGLETKVRDLAHSLCQLVSPQTAVNCRGEQRRGDPYHWCADITLLRALLPDWQPASLSVSLAKCLAIWQKD